MRNEFKHICKEADTLYIPCLTSLRHMLLAAYIFCPWGFKQEAQNSGFDRNTVEGVSRTFQINPNVIKELGKVVTNMKFLFRLISGQSMCKRSH